MKTDSIPLVEQRSSLRSLAERRAACDAADGPHRRATAARLPGPGTRPDQCGLSDRSAAAGGDARGDPRNPPIGRCAGAAVWGSRSCCTAIRIGCAVAAYSTSARGSGVVGIAALRNGAASVTACDNDADARDATRANARHQRRATSTCAPTSPTPAAFDLVLMADVLYDRANLPLLDAVQRIAPAVVVADSRVAEIPAAGFRQITQIDALTQPNLNEFDEFRTVRVFAYGAFEDSSGGLAVVPRYRTCGATSVADALAAGASASLASTARLRHRIGVDARVATHDHVATEQPALQRLQRLALAHRSPTRRGARRRRSRRPAFRRSVARARRPTDSIGRARSACLRDVRACASSSASHFVS